MNIVIYARYSSHSQTEQSIEGQLKACYEYTKSNGYNVIEEYIDRAVTGTSDNRPEFLRMIEDSNDKNFNGVLVYQLDRFARNRYDSAIYKNALKKNGVRVLSAKENISNDASGILVEGLLESMAEYYSAELSQKIQRGMKINASKFLYNGGNNVPLGFKISVDKKFEVDESTAFIVRQVFEMYASGITMAEIIRYLNSQGLKTSRGNDFNKNSIRRILINKKYIGTYTYKDKETPDAIPRIVENSLFEKVQEMMGTNKKAPARSRAKAEYLLTTKLFCGHCKDMMTGFSGTSKTSRKYNYYACNSAKKKQCDKKNARKDIIEDLVIKEARAILTIDNIERIATTVKKRIDEEKDNPYLVRFNKLLKESEKKKSNLIKSVSECEIESVRRSLYEELERIEEKIVNCRIEKAKEESPMIKLTKTEIKFFLNEMKKGNVNDVKYKKLLINVLVNKIYLYDNKMIIVFNTQDKPLEIKVPLLNYIESSLMGAVAPPNKKQKNH